MIAFNRLMKDRRRGGIGWAAGMAFGVAATVALWPALRDSGEIDELVQDLPASMRALIGVQDGIPLVSAPGFLQARLFSTLLPVLVLVYGIGLGARAIGGAEEDGTLELALTSPVTRRRLALERLAASVALMLGLTAVGLLTAVAVGAAVGIFDGLSAIRMCVAALAVWTLALLHFAVAFAVGAAVGRRGPAVTVATSLAVAGFVLHGLTASAPALRGLRVLSPWWWFLDRNLLVHDPTVIALGLPVLLALALAVGGVVAFERRDLRLP